MDVNQGKANALAFINASMPRYAGELVIMDGITLETPYSWVFVFAHRKLLETKDRRYALFGGSNAVELDKSSGAAKFITRSQLKQLRGSGSE